MYDAVVADRNVYSRNLTEATEEISQMDREFKIVFRSSGGEKYLIFLLAREISHRTNAVRNISNTL